VREQKKVLSNKGTLKQVVAPRRYNNLLSQTLYKAYEMSLSSYLAPITAKGTPEEDFWKKPTDGKQEVSNS
jgi:hypothetical protein